MRPHAGRSLFTRPTSFSISVLLSELIGNLLSSNVGMALWFVVVVDIDPYITGGTASRDGVLGPGRNTTLFEFVTAPEPARQAAIDELCWMIENAGRAGIRGLNYNFCPVGSAPSLQPRCNYWGHFVMAMEN